MRPKTPQSPTKRQVLGQPSWQFHSDCVEASVTELGGHLGPVSFQLKTRKVQPYSVAPWVEEKSLDSLPVILQVLRGDFFCLPFGGNSTPYRRERHPVHGETANARWQLESLTQGQNRQCLHLSLQTKVRPGRVDKRITLVDGQPLIYSQHTISNMTGAMNLGHHAMVKFPDQPGSGLISTSPFIYGQVFPDPFELPEQRGYSTLQPGATFDSLERVPTQTGQTVDLTRYPARRGFEDLIMIVSDPELPFAWTAVSFPKERYVWFALKNPRVLRQTIFWISNGGRHYSPWNGRHVNVLGLEEVTSYFHVGLAEAAGKNPLSARGIPTTIQLSPHKATVVPYIMGVVAIPSGFDRVQAIERGDSASQLILRSQAGKSVTATVDADFLRLP